MELRHPRARGLASAILVTVLAACGGATPSTPTPARNTPSWVTPARVPFRTTLPDGTVVALDDGGIATVDGERLGALHEDGRLAAPTGATIAALLPDGRISFDGALTGARIEGARLVEGGVGILEVTTDGRLTIRLPDGRELAQVPVLGVEPDSRATVLFVVGVHYLSLATRVDAIADLHAQEAEAGVVRVRVPLEGRPLRGSPSAPITIVMVEDFECPFCARAAATMRELEERYGERVRFAFVHRPLPFHRHAEDAAAFVEEALAQRGPEGFWAAYDLLFENHRALSRDDLERYGAALGLDVARLRTALDDGRHDERIEADDTLAQRIGATGTPAFFVNGVRILGAQPVDVFVQAIDRELAAAERLARLGVAPGQLYAVRMRYARDEAPPEPPRAAAARPRDRDRLDPAAVYHVPIDGAPARGQADALVTIVIFSDFQCPFCSRVLPTLERIAETYGREVRFVFRHNPLPFHQDARPAAEAAIEAFTQRGAAGFWRMHDVLFENQEALSREDLERYAAAMRLDVRRFRRALDAHTHAGRIETDQELARSLGASGTPAFFVNGRNLRGAQPYEEFARVIDEELARARAQLATGTPRSALYEALIRDGARAPVVLAE